MTTSCITIIR